MLAKFPNWLKPGRRAAARKNLRRPGTFRPELELLEDRLAPATFTWTGNGADDLWSNAANWDVGVPVDGADVVIPATANSAEVLFDSSVAGSGVTLNSLTSDGTNPVGEPFRIAGAVLTLSGAGTFTFGADLALQGGNLSAGGADTDVVNIDNLALSGGTLTVKGTTHVFNAMNFTGGTVSGTGLVTIGGLLTWSNGSMNGSGRTSADGGIAFNVSSLDRMVGWRLDNAGLATWTGAGDLTLQEGAVFNNNGTFDVQNDRTIVNGSAPAVFNNNGTFKKSAGAGTSTIGITFNNAGNVVAQTGTFRFDDGGTSTGTWTVSAPAVLAFGFGTHDFNAGSMLTGAGTARFIGTTNLAVPYSVSHTEITGGNVNFNANSSTTSLFLDGILAGSGDLTIGGLLTWNGGNMNGPGKTFANGGLALTGSGRMVGRRLDNAGLATWTGSGDLTVQEGAVFNNNGTFDIQNDRTIVNGSAPATFINNGTLKKSAGSGTSAIGIDFTNNGTVDVQSGALSFASTVTNLSGGTLTGGTWMVRSNAALSTSTGIATNQANVILDGVNSVFPSVGTNGANGVFTIQNGDNFTPPTAFNNNGLVHISANSTFTITNGGTSTGDWDIAATGALSVNSGSYLFDNGTDVSGAGMVVVTSASLIGTLNVGDDAADVVNISDLRIGPSFSQGTVNATGTLHVTGQMDLGFNHGTGNLSGTGNVTVGGLLTLVHGTMSGSGTTSANGGMSLQIEGGGFDLRDGRHLDNNAPATWTSNAGQPLVFRNGAVFNNNNTFDIQVDAGMANGNIGADLPNAINNTGTFKKTAGTGGATAIDLPFNNNGGAVDVQTGEITLRGGGTSTGPWTVAAPADLRFVGGTFNLNTGSVVSGAGAVLFEFGTVNFADTYNVTTTRMTFSGTANFNAAASTTTLDLSGWTLGGSGDFTVNGLFTWRGGIVTGNGTMFANGDMTITIPIGNATLDGRRLDLASNHTATWLSGSQAVLFANGAVFNNNGTFDAQNDGSFQAAFVGATSFFNNNGTFKKSTGNGTTSVGGSGQLLSFNNAGTVDARSGTLDLRNVVQVDATAPGTLNGGTWKVLTTSTLTLNGGAPLATNNANVILDGVNSNFTNLANLATNNGSFTVQNGSDFSAAAFANNGAVTVGSGSTFTSAGGFTQSASGILSGTGTVAANVTSAGQVNPGASPGRLTINGSYTQTAGGRLNIEIGGRNSDQFDVLAVSGQATLDGTLTISLVGGLTPLGSDAFLVMPFASRTGDFATFNGSSFPGGIFTRQFHATDLTLDVDVAPTAGDDSDTTLEDHARTINVLGNDSDADGDPITVTAITQPAHGVVVNNGSDVTYTPAVDFNGDDTFNYTVSDPFGLSATATVTVKVTAVNDAPTLDTIANQPPVDEDSGAHTVTMTSISPGGGVDEAGQTITLTATSSNPTVVPNPVITGSGATRTLTYTPAANANGRYGQRRHRYVAAHVHNHGQRSQRRAGL